MGPGVDDLEAFRGGEAELGVKTGVRLDFEQLGFGACCSLGLFPVKVGGVEFNHLLFTGGGDLLAVETAFPEEHLADGSSAEIEVSPEVT